MAAADVQQGWPRRMPACKQHRRRQGLPLCSGCVRRLRARAVAQPHTHQATVQHAGALGSSQASSQPAYVHAQQSAWGQATIRASRHALWWLEGGVGGAPTCLLCLNTQVAQRAEPWHVAGASRKMRLLPSCCEPVVAGRRPQTNCGGAFSYRSYSCPLIIRCRPLDCPCCRRRRGCGRCAACAASPLLTAAAPPATGSYASLHMWPRHSCWIST